MYAQSWDLTSSEKAQEKKEVQQSETVRRRSDMEEGMSGFCIKATGGGGGGGGGTGGGTKCGRWNPTAEQVKVLTDLFRSGLRTPSTDQIQRISTQLSYYGKIESKNVFYWFQNHKARERQKRRRVSTVVVEDNRCGLTERDHHHHYHHNNNNKLYHPKHIDYAEIHHHHHVSVERERGGEIETLQLFPLNAYKEMSEPNEKLKVFRNNEYKENMFSWGMRKENIDHLPLDLRLSFM